MEQIKTGETSILPNLSEIPLKIPQINDKLPELEELPSLPAYKDPEMEKSNFYTITPEISKLPEPVVQKIEIPTSPKPSAPEVVKIPSQESIFIKLKRFEKAMGSFDDVKKKLEEMKEELDKSKKILAEEQKELEEWEGELTQMKASLEIVDKNLFMEL